jgi:hypothetical protein
VPIEFAAMSSDGLRPKRRSYQFRIVEFRIAEAEESVGASPPLTNCLITIRTTWAQGIKEVTDRIINVNFLS